MTTARASSRTPVRPYNNTITPTNVSVGKDVLSWNEGGGAVMPAEMDEESGGDDVGAEDQEVEPMRTAPDPELPTEAEVDDHRIDHTPYRSWCEWCRRARGLGEQRGHGANKPHLLAVLAMDYFFLTRDSVETHDSLTKLDFARDPEGDEKLEAAIGDGTIVKCLLLKDLKSKAMFAWVVPNKGRDSTGFVVDQLTVAVKWLGYTNLVLKSDNEPAILALLRDTLRAIRINVDAA